LNPNPTIASARPADSAIELGNGPRSSPAASDSAMTSNCVAPVAP
jgi:hypothetical protein